LLQSFLSGLDVKGCAVSIVASTCSRGSWDGAARGEQEKYKECSACNGDDVSKSILLYQLVHNE
jgi:hypothetical protein